MHSSEWISRCRKHLASLQTLVLIHIEIDSLISTINANEPDYVYHLRKVSRHSVALAKCAVDADGLHVIAVELRPAIDQMNSVLKFMPAEYRPDLEEREWRNKIGDGLSVFCHPTLTNVSCLPLDLGGFNDASKADCYKSMAVWLRSFLYEYQMALIFLVDSMGVSKEFVTSLRAAATD